MVVVVSAGVLEEEVSVEVDLVAVSAVAASVVAVLLADGKTY